jgi:pimeloyl-ACP methyl ester carboxylesterase
MMRRSPAGALLVVVVVVFFFAACARVRGGGGQATVPAEASAPAPAASSDAAGSADSADSAVSADVVAPPPPLEGFFDALVVPDHADAWMSLPTGATGMRPVVVVIHGAGDRPDWQCGGWRHATDGYPFVVCPRGSRDAASSTKDDVRYTHAGGAPLLAYIDAALDALAARFPRYADTSTPLLVGFSLGASEILALAVQTPSRFPRIAMIEGGWAAWTDARASAFVKGGGQRVLFGAGQQGVRTSMKPVAKRLVAEGVDARVVFAPVGHTFDPPLEDAVREELGWLVQGDARWP